MAWRKLNNPDNSNPNNTLVALSDMGACCDQTEGTLKNCVVSAHNLTSSPIDTIVIGGVEYEFTQAATTALLQGGINSALIDANYIDVNDPDAPRVVGTIVSGDASAAYISVIHAGTITKMITSGGSDVNFVCTNL